MNMVRGMPSAHSSSTANGCSRARGYTCSWGSCVSTPACRTVSMQDGLQCLAWCRPVACSQDEQLPQVYFGCLLLQA